MISSMSIQNSKQTDQLPLASSHVLFYNQSVLHSWTVTDVFSAAIVEPIKLKHQIAYFELVVQGQRKLLSWFYSAENLLVGYESSSDYLGYWFFGSEDKIGVIAEIERIPSNLQSELSQWLVYEMNIKSFVNLFLIVPFLHLCTHSYQLFFILIRKRKLLEVVVLCGQQLCQCPDSIVLQHITKVRYMVSHAYFLNLVKFSCLIESHNEWTNCIELPIFDLHTLFWYIHPCTCLALEVHHVEILKTIEFQLSMFLRKPSSFDLQSQAVMFSVTRSHDLSVLVSSYIEESVFKDALDAIEHVLDMQLLYFCDIELEMHGIVVVFFDEIHLILIGFPLLFGLFLGLVFLGFLIAVFSSVGLPHAVILSYLEAYINTQFRLSIN